MHMRTEFWTLTSKISANLRRNTIYVPECFILLVWVGGGRLHVMFFVMLQPNTSIPHCTGLFLEAWQQFTIPSRVHCDHGTENVDVARWMIETRALNRRSVISGSSVHNQRTERLWQDLRRAVVRPFANLFYSPEWCTLLDPLSENDLYALHYVPQ